MANLLTALIFVYFQSNYVHNIHDILKYSTATVLIKFEYMHFFYKFNVEVADCPLPD
jgi:hypothetical protein